MERTTVATRSWLALGTLDMRFLMKTPESPRATSPRRKDVHPDPSSLVKRASLPLTCSMEANEETEVGSFGQR
jgi:hypothetical protein